MNKSYIEWIDYYENATKEDVIQDMMLDINSIKEKDKEIERLKKENNDLRKLYQRTSEHLFDMGDAELARYFQAQIDECPTFYVEPIIDYYKEYNRLNNIINEFEKWLQENIKISKAHYNQIAVNIFNVFLDKLKELKGSDK